MTKASLQAFAVCSFVIIALTNVLGQGIQPYPNAITDRVVRTETPMAPPPVNIVFNDPDLGSPIVRVSDETTNFRHPGGYLRSPAVWETNTWSADDSKFYFIGRGGNDFAFAFDPSTMATSSLPRATAGQALLLPLRPGPTFSFIDPDLMYGTTNANRFTISQYRFSTNKVAPVIDTTTCGLQPPINTQNSKIQSDDDVSLSADDRRISISEGGPQPGEDPFVVVYDQNLGCRWYNTQTGQIGGQWGQTGFATVPAGFLINHAFLSGDGQHVKISALHFGFYIWDVATLNVVGCQTHTSHIALVTET
ncbi:MAG TPA: hypothetical protein VF011_18775 [Terriglobales bacterium]